MSIFRLLFDFFVLSDLVCLPAVVLYGFLFQKQGKLMQFDFTSFYFRDEKKEWWKSYKWWYYGIRNKSSSLAGLGIIASALEVPITGLKKVSITVRVTLLTFWTHRKRKDLQFTEIKICSTSAFFISYFTIMNFFNRLMDFIDNRVRLYFLDPSPFLFLIWYNR